MPEPARTIATSLCAQPRDEPRAFHWYLNADGSEHVRKEIVELIWSLGLTMHRAAGLVGDVEAKMKRAARGQLRSAEDLKPVRLHPTLWELRWSESAGLFRLYHAEPGTEPDLVALRFHRKDTGLPSQQEIDAAQDAEMDTAQSRYERRVNDKWGHVERCSDCLHP